MNNLPIQIRQQYEQFQSLMESKTIFGAMVKFRDLTEVMLRLPVLCAGAFILEKGGSERELLTIELVRQQKIDGLGWFKIARLIGSNKNIPKPLQNAISHVYGFIKSESILEWRNAEVAHGALKFNPDKAFMRDFNRKIKALKKILKKLDKDFKDITVTPDGSSVTFENATLSVVPYIHSDDGEAYLFNSFGNGLAKGLCYALGTKRSMPSEQYIQAYKTQGSHRLTTGVTSDVITTELSALIDELNEAANFEHPTYLRDWLVECMNANGSGIKKGTLMLEMERGMGKSAFSRALDGKSTDSEYKSFKISDTFTRGYYCSRISIKSKGDFIYGISNSLLTDAQEKPLYSSDEKIPSLSEDSTPKDFAELLNWSYEHIGERRLLLIIDGIDEIPSEHVSILKMLPSAEMLHDGIYILLTCRSKVELPKGKKEEDYTPEEKISFNENKHIDIVKSLVAPDRHREYLRNDAHNFEVLKSYFNHKIFPKGKSQSEDILKELIEQPGNLRFLEVRIIGALLKSAKIKDIDKFLKQPDLFHYYMDYLRTEEYGDAVFFRLTDVMVALACAQEELTFDELAYILGEDDITIQLLTFIRDMSGILRISRDYRGNHISLATEAYRDIITSENTEAVSRHKESLADILRYVDINEAKIKDDDNTETLPDGLTYIATYLPTLLEDISKDLVDKVWSIDKYIEKNMQQYILSRRANMGKGWSEHCKKLGLYEYELKFILISGKSYLEMQAYNTALINYNKMVILSEDYLASKKINNYNMLVVALIQRGDAYIYLDQLEKAESDLDDSLELINRLQKQSIYYDYEAHINLLLTKSVLYYNLGSDMAALSILEKVTDMVKNLHSQGILYRLNAEFYLNRGCIYDEIEQYGKALLDYNEGISIARKNNDNSALINLLHNRGITYINIGLADKALKDFNKSIKIMRTIIGYDKCVFANLLKSRGILYHDMGSWYDQNDKFKKALEDYNECIDILKKLKREGKFYNKNLLSQVLQLRGNLFQNIGDDENATKNFNQYKIIQFEPSQNIEQFNNDDSNNKKLSSPVTSFVDTMDDENKTFFELLDIDQNKEENLIYSKSRLHFIINEKTIDELIKEAKSYSLIQMKIKSSKLPKDELEKKLSLLLDAELCTYIALIYHFYKKKNIQAIFNELKLDNVEEISYKINFGNSYKQRQFICRLCDMLINLNLDIISKNRRLEFFYNDLTELIEKDSASNKNTLLNNVDFWNLYFSFYEEYVNRI